MTEKAEIDVLDPVAEVLTLVNGQEIIIEDLRTRQFFKLLRILTRGAGPLLMEYRLDGDLNSEEFTTRLLALVVLSVPEAEDEAVEFLASMVRPAGITVNPRTPAEKQANEERWTALRLSLDNPELEDTVTILEAVVRREAADIQSLGKRLQAMMTVAEKSGQAPKTTRSSAASRASSTSSQSSTAGQTSKS